MWKAGHCSTSVLPFANASVLWKVWTFVIGAETLVTCGPCPRRKRLFTSLCSQIKPYVPTPGQPYQHLCHFLHCSGVVIGQLQLLKLLQCQAVLLLEVG